MSCSIFINYRRNDSAGYAHALYGRLCEEFANHEIFMDVDIIEPGEDFILKIEIAVSECDIFIALIGKIWLTAEDQVGRKLDNPNDFVRLEIKAALERNIQIIPVLVDGASPLNIKDLPSDLAPLARLQALELSSTRFDTDLQRLTKLIRKVLEKKEDRENLSSKRHFVTWDRIKVNRRVFLFYISLTSVGAAIGALWYLILGRNLTPPSSEEHNSKTILKKNNPRFVTKRRQRDSFTSLPIGFHRNSKSNIIHYVLPSKVIRFVSSINESNFRKPPVIQAKDLTFDKSGSRVHLMGASLSFEDITMKLIQEKKYGDAVVMLKNALMHDRELQRRSGKRANFRLYDLFAGLSVRYNRPENIEYAIDVIKKSNQMQIFSDRMANWTNKSTRWYRGWINKRNSKLWAGLPM